MARLRALPQVLQASLGPFGVPAAHFRPHIPGGDSYQEAGPPTFNAGWRPESAYSQHTSAHKLAMFFSFFLERVLFISYVPLSTKNRG